VIASLDDQVLNDAADIMKIGCGESCGNFPIGYCGIVRKIDVVASGATEFTKDEHLVMPDEPEQP
jgi:hypothetical protein